MSKPFLPSVARWRERVGPRSFILQVVLAAWSFVMLLALLWSVTQLQAEAAEAQGWRSKKTAEAASGAAACMVFGVWLVVALPLGIAAVATLPKQGDGGTPPSP